MWPTNQSIYQIAHISALILGGFHNTEYGISKAWLTTHKPESYWPQRWIINPSWELKILLNVYRRVWDLNRRQPGYSSSTSSPSRCEWGHEFRFLLGAGQLVWLGVYWMIGGCWLLHWGVRLTGSQSRATLVPNTATSWFFFHSSQPPYKSDLSNF